MEIGIYLMIDNYARETESQTRDWHEWNETVKRLVFLILKIVNDSLWQPEYILKRLNIYIHNEFDYYGCQRKSPQFIFDLLKSQCKYILIWFLYVHKRRQLLSIRHLGYF